jgi:hypothetical protein
MLKESPDSPPVEYALLIRLALAESESGEMSKKEICAWLQANFNFFDANHIKTEV